MQTLNHNFQDSINWQPNNFVDCHGEEGMYLFIPQNSNTRLTRLKHGYRCLGKWLLRKQLLKNIPHVFELLTLNDAKRSSVQTDMANCSDRSKRFLLSLC